MKRRLRALLGVAVMTAAAASALPTLAADDWLNLATVSMTNATTPKLTDRYVCYTDGQDIACNRPSLYVTTGGLVGISTTTPSRSFVLQVNNSDGREQGVELVLELQCLQQPPVRHPGLREDKPPPATWG